jgi:pyrroline-5-carboxylate reductase
MNLKIAFIGGGNMGEAMLAAVIKKKLATPAVISVSDISDSRRDYLKKQYSVAVTRNNRVAIKGKDIIVLAVKPQNISEVLSNLKVDIISSQLVLSIAAGVSINTISQELGHNNIVRAMPNTPAQVGFGMSGWTATAIVTTTQKEQARAILAAMGREIYFDDEEYLDKVTAVSGSGPAYFYLFVESLIEAAVNIGISRPDAEQLVRQTIVGSAQLLLKSGKPPAELRRAVASKGGTTERALDVFEEGGLARLVKAAVQEAYRRAKELGKKSGHL